MPRTQIFIAYFYKKSTFTKSDYILKEIKPTAGVGGGLRPESCVGKEQVYLYKRKKINQCPLSGSVLLKNKIKP